MKAFASAGFIVLNILFCGYSINSPYITVNLLITKLVLSRVTLISKTT
jgi:hypothetical protein